MSSGLRSAAVAVVDACVIVVVCRAAAGRHAAFDIGNAVGIEQRHVVHVDGRFAAQLTLAIPPGPINVNSKLRYDFAR